MRVIVAEDSVLLGLLAEALPRYQIEVTGQASTTQELLRLVTADPPDLVVLDIRMPRADPRAPAENAGLDAARQIRNDHPGVAILVLSNYDHITWTEQVADLGRAAGYLLKDKVNDLDELVEIMRQVAAGALRIDQDLVRRLLARKRSGDPVKQLTPAEVKVLRLMTEGMSDAEIARRLHIKAVAVETHAMSICRKLGLPLADRTGGREPDVYRRVRALLSYLRSGPALGSSRHRDTAAVLPPEVMPQPGTGGERLVTSERGL